MTVPPLDGPDVPHLRAMMLVVDAEMTAGGAGGRLAAEFQANVLAVHLIRYVLKPRRLRRGRDGALPQGRLRAVVAYIEEHLGASPTLDQMAAVARPFCAGVTRQMATHRSNCESRNRTRVALLRQHGLQEPSPRRRELRLCRQVGPLPQAVDRHDDLLCPRQPEWG
jgi:hypothetical protein